MGVEIPLEKIDDYRWRIPKTYKPGMRVPGVIYADRKMLDQILSDNAPEQVANVAFLPGIVKYSLAMPDIHWGYGFCLAGDTKILTNFGFYKPIKSFEKDWSNQNIISIDFNSKQVIDTSIVRFLKLKPKKMFKVITKSGHEIRATGDHPLLTPLGMRSVKELSTNEKIAVFSFQGVSYEKPSSKIIISEKDIRKTLLSLKRKPQTPKFEVILRKLKERNLLTLTYNHPKLPYILKIMGFVFGDASMNFIGKRGDGVLHFAGKPQDLEEARKDLKKIGYTPSPLHFQKVGLLRKGKMKYYNCCSFLVNASSLVILLEALGVPRGNKVSQSYRVPKWIFKTPPWQRRLFLASLFGCELRTPHRRLDRKGYFNAPVFPMAKREELIENGKDFLWDISKLLKEFGVKTLYIDKRRKHVNTKGEISWALELLISPKPENLFNLWGKIGFEYNLERSFKANVAVQYIRLKQKVLREKEEAIKITIPQLLKRGLSYQKIALKLAGNPLTGRFITDVCYRLNKGEKIIPRIPFSFPLFEDYLEEVTRKLGKSGMVWDEIKEIKKIIYKDYVYDFTVSHSDHNFIADNFVVSNCIGGVAAMDPSAGGVISPGGIGYDINCGVRLMRTDLEYKDVHPHIDKLVHSLFHDIPCGVGQKGEIRINAAELKKLVTRGSAWAVARGYGEQRDVEFTEQRGCLEGAVPDTLTPRAVQRGLNQPGTLGSGNHFLEVQLVEHIYEPEAAEVFGLFKGQITVMVHSGSRGFGYQVCDDSLRYMGPVPARYGFAIPDRQLACAPIDSPEGKKYYAEMCCAANYAWVNRQVLMHLCRRVFASIFGRGYNAMGMDLVYDVAHNIGKFEKHQINGTIKELFVHRKGATRAFAAGHPVLPGSYRETGQPVIIPGDMGRNSYVMVGTEKAMTDTFGSVCHGAGRVMSRSKAIRTLDYQSILKQLKEKGIVVMSKGKKGFLEEAPAAYKDINDVVGVVHNAGIARMVARMKPLGVIKG